VTYWERRAAGTFEADAAARAAELAATPTPTADPVNDDRIHIPIGGSGDYVTAPDATGTPGNTDTITSDWTWLAAPTTSAPGSAGKAAVDTDNPRDATLLWLHRIDNNSTDWGAALQRLNVGDLVYLQQRNLATSWHRYLVTGTPTLDTNAWSIPVTTESGSDPGTEPAGSTAILVAFHFHHG